ncbi:Transducin family protein / WD-40 repeat family protein [Euphorbia peplus]|nr:Transducin family protein / WD-40 repeat family protein [Euphorbia peplus]
MAEQEQQHHRTRRLQSGQYLGEISALCFLHLPPHLSPLPYLLAGTGSQILLYNLETAKIVESFQVFEGIRVHGITCGFIDSSGPEGLCCDKVCFELAVFGERRVKLFKLEIEVGVKLEDEVEVCLRLHLVHCLPRFSHWVLDVCFFKEKSHCLAIGCSNNSVSVWDISKSSLILEVQSPEKCLLYTMRLWGDNLEGLQIASGTIYNQILIWKIVPQHGTSASSLEEDEVHRNSSFPNSFQLHKAVHISRLIGHEGSIFRIVWSPDGSKLVSVSDDRSARIWVVEVEQSDSCNGEEGTGSVLFGHAARVWDCCMFGSLIMTAGEDCTCRVWGLDGKQLKTIKEHIGRGVWRCLYDPNSSLLITAGFDSAIKVHQLPAFLQSLEGEKESDQFIDRTEIITSRIPNSSEHPGLMDSKSEYVRCLEFSCEDTLYVATNNGYLYHVTLTEGVKWTKLAQVSEKVPIICMDLLSGNLAGNSCSADDWLALGDGKGKVTIVRIIGDVCTPDMDFSCTWSAEKERQLLGTYWCRALGYRFIFTADPRGVLKLWNLHDPLLSVSHDSARDFSVSLVAEFTSNFGYRIMCVDASSEDEVLVCGDVRGNLIIFPLTKGLLLSTPALGGIKVSPLSCFKGAHGISSVSSISLSKLSSNEIEICSTGADGCICHFDYEEDKRTLEFIGMKQVKELSLVESAPANSSPYGSENIGYAVGFASTDFIIWNLTTEAKVLQIPCGGWRRPHSYYLGDVPEMTTCLAYVKDEIIYFHRLLIQQKEMRIYPQNLHIQFHGREVHSLCFISKNTPIEENVKSGRFDKSRWIATGCEDGTVRLTRYIPGVDSWSSSKLLGEHVGGSAVRSICFVSKMHIISSDRSNLYDWRSKQEERDNPFLLISVGAKRVLTSWLLRDRGLDKKAHPLIEHDGDGNEYMAHMGASSSMSFKWLSTDMPAKNSSTLRKAKNMEKIGGLNENIAGMEAEAKSRSPLQEQGETELKSSPNDEDDWRYMAVTAFLVKCTGSRLAFCFTVVACSDATLALRALVLPHRLWVDVALLVPLSSPVLALQHVVIPAHLPSGESIGNVYLVISGATDGSIAFWNLTDCIESFVRQLSSLDTEKIVNCPTRPRTGRGSQGGRWWKSLSNSKVKKETIDDLAQGEKRTNCLSVDQAMVRPSTNGAESCTTESPQAMHNVNLDSEANNVDIVPQICEIQPLHVFSNVHQSGVNCLHVSYIEHSQDSDYGFFFSVTSGGDDQALHCLRFEVLLLSTGEDSETVKTDIIDASKNMNNSTNFGQYQTNKCRIRLTYHDKVSSAHSSAIKGVWTDGTWVFTTGLDQRIRCWFLKDRCKLTEYSTLIISVPEPEALHARACESDRYEIVVAGRGMQMVDFLPS